MRWSALKPKISALFDPKLHLDINCTVQRGPKGAGVGRYWFSLSGEIVWDQPKNVSLTARTGGTDQSAREMGAILREYLDVPPEQLLTTKFEGDLWGLSDMLLAADRRIGKRQLHKLRTRCRSPVAQRILDERFGVE